MTTADQDANSTENTQPLPNFSLSDSPEDSCELKRSLSPDCAAHRNRVIKKPRLEIHVPFLEREELPITRHYCLIRLKLPTRQELFCNLL
jgi:hypothetical protein